MAVGLPIGAVEREVAEAMTAASVPGHALAAVRGEEMVYARGFGMTSAEPRSGTRYNQRWPRSFARLRCAIPSLLNVLV